MKVYVLLVIGIWIGLVFGLSFIEAPIKFQAPGISTKLGLGIGRLVFDISNKIQLALLSFVLLNLFLNIKSFPVITIVLFGAIAFVMAIQTFYLLPALDARAVKILQDLTVEVSYHHFSFVCLEIIKLISLILLFLNLHHLWKT